MVCAMHYSPEQFLRSPISGPSPAQRNDKRLLHVHGDDDRVV